MIKKQEQYNSQSRGMKIKYAIDGLFKDFQEYDRRKNERDAEANQLIDNRENGSVKNSSQIHLSKPSSPVKTNDFFGINLLKLENDSIDQQDQTLSYEISQNKKVFRHKKSKSQQFVINLNESSPNKYSRDNKSIIENSSKNFVIGSPGKKLNMPYLGQSISNIQFEDPSFKKVQDKKQIQETNNKKK